MVLASREASETFIAREIEALQKRGFPLVVMEGGRPRAPKPARGARGRAPSMMCPPLKHLAPRILEELLALAPRNAFRIWRHRGEVAAVVAMARETGASRLHAQFAWVAADVVGIAANILNIPWSCGVHAWDVFTRPTSELRRRLRGAEFVIACNERARDAVARAVDCPAHLVRHGVRLDSEITNNNDREPSRITAIGRLVPKKGFDTLLVAMAGLCHKEARCVFIGDGPERGGLERLATRLGIAPRVEFLGRLAHDDALRRLARSTLLALPSRRTRGGDSDGFANVLAEAMQRGVPVVTTTAAGAGELLVDGESALLVPPDAPACLAKAMDRLLGDLELQKHLAANARRVLETRLSEEVEIRKTANLLFAF